ncbi:Grx4 family monothiol glutaredoxin [Gloeobacter kilaueensis]|uniref:Glutaredoxin n=1 Tax=Gloeobacter kilaueensis (strain ATCC BAA-2537 / CCAP 1431/1 / ULC 316 / JS1) TaxID=1183438 RepID=U5QJX7_GLOK1|nr:Grx4 family monothiol glutaredoxin [Gloeobacter kilaueensis]AGY59287.1 glutaredoxin [Gloeobacter kilaueensis JS1]
MSQSVQEKIDSLVKNNKVLIFMKGTPQFPQCGFSAASVQILSSLGYPFEAVNVLEDFEIRQGVKEYANWPTIPQVYVDGEFIGGCDILIEMHNRGELKPLVEQAFAGEAVK